jgi:hypothetical protein
MLPSEAQKQGVQKRQAVFSLDFETWEDIVQIFNIRESIIPDRTEQEEAERQKRSMGRFYG